MLRGGDRGGGVTTLPLFVNTTLTVLSESLNQDNLIACFSETLRGRLCGFAPHGGPPGSWRRPRQYGACCQPYVPCPSTFQWAHRSISLLCDPQVEFENALAASRFAPDYHTVRWTPAACTECRAVAPWEPPAMKPLGKPCLARFSGLPSVSINNFVHPLNPTDAKDRPSHRIPVQKKSRRISVGVALSR